MVKNARRGWAEFESPQCARQDTPQPFPGALAAYVALKAATGGSEGLATLSQAHSGSL